MLYRYVFRVAFGPQPLWVLLTFLPNSKVTKTLMKPWWTVIAFSLVHLLIVVLSASQESATAPLAEFANVWDPSKDTQAGMSKLAFNLYSLPLLVVFFFFYRHLCL